MRFKVGRCRDGGSMRFKVLRSKKGMAMGITKDDHEWLRMAHMFCTEEDFEGRMAELVRRLNNSFDPKEKVEAQ